MESSHPVSLSCYPVNFKLHAVIMTYNFLYVSAPSNMLHLLSNPQGLFTERLSETSTFQYGIA
jgi:hypothetical protein